MVVQGNLGYVIDRAQRDDIDQPNQCYRTLRLNPKIGLGNKNLRNFGVMLSVSEGWPVDGRRKSGGLGTTGCKVSKAVTSVFEEKG